MKWWHTALVGFIYGVLIDYIFPGLSLPQSILLILMFAFPAIFYADLREKKKQGCCHVKHDRCS